MKQPKTRKIAVFRHGKTWYLQDNEEIRRPKVAFDLAKGEKGKIDLYHAAMLEEQEIRENTEKLLPFLDSNRFIEVDSSPTGRGLHTARQIVRTLQMAGFHQIRQRTARILTEVKNFEVALYLPLVFGGQVTYRRKTFKIDPTETNPLGLAEPLFWKNGIQAISEEAKGKWPKAYRKNVESWETAAQCSSRVMEALTRYATAPPVQKILVTHGFFGNPLAQIHTGDPDTELPKGSWILLSGNQEMLHTVRMPGYDQGHSEYNLFRGLEPEFLGR